MSIRAVAEHILKLALALAVVLGLVIVTGPAPARASEPSPDTIFIGQFLTLDSEHPRAEALAVSKGRILAIGSRKEIEPLAGKGTRTVQLAGVAVPGFADAHIHVEGIGAQLEKFDLRGLDKTAVLAKVAEAAKTTPAGAWIQGEGWDEGFWKPSVFPTAKELDAVSGDHPVALGRIDEHSVWVNSKALALAGISRSTPDPEGGLIRRDADGEPTGLLVDNARELASKVIPKPTRADRERRLRAALLQIAKWGLTSVQDAGVGLETISIYKDLLQQGALTARVYAMAGEGAIPHYLETGPEPDLGGGMLSVRSFKLFLDGALGSRGAELTEPYTDAPKEHGLQLMKDPELARIVAAALQKGFQVNTHAIGDRAVSRALDAFEHAGVTGKERFRVEHASVVTDDDVRRFARLGVIASMQPVFVGEYSRWSEDRVGPGRVHWVLRTRDMLNAGVAVAAGTDYPASDSGSPIATLHCLVTRQSATGQPPKGWYADQQVSVDQALRLMSAGPAFAAFRENDLGSLTRGRYADFTLLSADPYRIAPAELKNLMVRMTVVGGRIVFQQ